MKCPVCCSGGDANDTRLLGSTELDSVVEYTRCGTDLLPGFTRWSRAAVSSPRVFARLVRVRRPDMGATDAETEARHHRTLNGYVARKLSRLPEGSPPGDFARRIRSVDFVIDQLPPEEREGVTESATGYGARGSGVRPTIQARPTPRRRARAPARPATW
jgi:hypothetical protein